MIGVSRSVRVWAYPEPTDLRKGYNGLLGLVTQGLGRDVLSGDLFLFVNRRRTSCKVLLWDGTGLCHGALLERAAQATPEIGVSIGSIHAVVSGVAFAAVPAVHPLVPGAIVAPGMFLSNLGIAPRDLLRGPAPRLRRPRWRHLRLPPPRRRGDPSRLSAGPFMRDHTRSRDRAGRPFARALLSLPGASLEAPLVVARPKKADTDAQSPQCQPVGEARSTVSVSVRESRMVVSHSKCSVMVIACFRGVCEALWRSVGIVRVGR